ncbi:MAG: YegP family protein, partial [Arthrobacter oryzae]
MAGVFEINETGQESYFFTLKAADGAVVAVSPLFSTIRGAAAGITAVRENAAAGLIVDQSDVAPEPAA